MENIALGRSVDYPTQYDKSVLFPIPRSINREKSQINPTFYGWDIWNCYEISWLNPKGKPEVRILEFFIPYDSKNLIESKSLKLYFFSFNNEKFASENEVLELMQNDLNEATQSIVHLKMKKMTAYESTPISKPEGYSIDHLDIDASSDHSSAEIIEILEEQASETIYTDLHKSNCLITHQPDWATLVVSYEGPKLDHGSLLKYIISHRNQDMFHEDSVEKIFSDINSRGNFTKLTIYARYTRRGGIDINPIRSNLPINLEDLENKRLARQ